MEPVDLWKFGHIVAMFVAVSIFVGQGMLEGAVARSGDVRALRRVLAAEDRFAPIGGGILLLGVVLGFVTAIVGDLDLTQAWLVIGYVLTAIIFVTRSHTTSRPPTSSRFSPLPAPTTSRRQSSA
jgi:hypothetical protein